MTTENLLPPGQHPGIEVPVELGPAHDANECVVNFEPEGAQHVLRKDDRFRVEAVLPANYPIEVAYWSSPAFVDI
jgi:hypothetical protein